MKVYQILGQRARLVFSEDGDDKVLPGRTIFKADPLNLSVKRLLRLNPPACRELVGDEIPQEFRTPLKEDIVVLLEEN